MQAIDGLTLARRLLNDHRLSDWTVRLDHARQRCGSCHFHTREITLSRHFVEMNDEHEITATVLHEIAHALAGPGSGHGPAWRRVAKRIGAPVQATNDTARMPSPPWGLRCVQCTRIVARRHRRALNLDYVRCRYCGERDGELVWEKLA